MILSIVNQLGPTYPDSKVYLGVMGQVVSDEYGYMHSDGSFIVAQPKNGNNYTDNVQFFTLSEKNDFELFPTIISGRCWIALDSGLNIPIAPDSFRGPGFNTPGDPNYNLIYDKFEFTLNSDSLNCNTTCVDYFGLPISIYLSSAPNRVVGIDKTQSEVFAAFSGTDFACLVLPGLRVLNPSKSSDLNTYFHGYINRCWSYYTQANPLTLAVNGGFVTGYPDSNGNFNFSWGGQIYTVKYPPSSSDVFACDGVFQPLGDPKSEYSRIDGQIKRQMAAAMNRGVFLRDTGSWCNANYFYQNETYNKYSKILHDNSIGGNCYGFAWDDVCNFYSTDVTGTTSDTLTVTLHPLN